MKVLSVQQVLWIWFSIEFCLAEDRVSIGVESFLQLLVVNSSQAIIFSDLFSSALDGPSQQEMGASVYVFQH